MLETFKSMNEVMRRAKSFKPVAKKEELLQMVATNNLLFLDIISKLGIMERFDIAWKNNNCNDIYEHLRTDMEIENRNSNLQVKVGSFALFSALSTPCSHIPLCWQRILIL